MDHQYDGFGLSVQLVKDSTCETNHGPFGQTVSLSIDSERNFANDRLNSYWTTHVIIRDAGFSADVKPRIQPSGRADGPLFSFHLARYFAGELPRDLSDADWSTRSR
jgi:hypothetical protein